MGSKFSKAVCVFPRHDLGPRKPSGGPAHDPHRAGTHQGRGERKRQRGSSSSKRWRAGKHGTPASPSDGPCVSGRDMDRGGAPGGGTLAQHLRPGAEPLCVDTRRHARERRLAFSPPHGGAGTSVDTGSTSAGSPARPRRGQGALHGGSPIVDTHGAPSTPPRGDVARGRWVQPRVVTRAASSRIHRPGDSSGCSSHHTPQRASSAGSLVLSRASRGDGGGGSSSMGVGSVPVPGRRRWIQETMWEARPAPPSSGTMHTAASGSTSRPGSTKLSPASALRSWGRAYFAGRRGNSKSPAGSDATASMCGSEAQRARKLSPAARYEAQQATTRVKYRVHRSDRRPRRSPSAMAATVGGDDGPVAPAAGLSTTQAIRPVATRPPLSADGSSRDYSATAASNFLARSGRLRPSPVRRSSVSSGSTTWATDMRTTRWVSSRSQVRGSGHVASERDSTTVRNLGDLTGGRTPHLSRGAADVLAWDAKAATARVDAARAAGVLAPPMPGAVSVAPRHVSNGNIATVAAPAHTAHEAALSPSGGAEPAPAPAKRRRRPSVERSATCRHVQSRSTLLPASPLPCKRSRSHRSRGDHDSRLSPTQARRSRRDSIEAWCQDVGSLAPAGCGLDLRANRSPRAERDTMQQHDATPRCRPVATSVRLPPSPAHATRLNRAERGVTGNGTRAGASARGRELPPSPIRPAQPRSTARAPRRHGMRSDSKRNRATPRDTAASGNASLASPSTPRQLPAVDIAAVIAEQERRMLARFSAFGSTRTESDDEVDLESLQPVVIVQCGVGADPSGTTGPPCCLDDLFGGGPSSSIRFRVPRASVYSRRGSIGAKRRRSPRTGARSPPLSTEGLPPEALFASCGGTTLNGHPVCPRDSGHGPAALLGGLTDYMLPQSPYAWFS